MDASKHWRGFQLVGSDGDDAYDLTQCDVYQHAARLRMATRWASVSDLDREAFCAGARALEALGRWFLTTRMMQE